MTHDGLADSLAGHLYGTDRMVWQDMQLGPSGSPRPDVYTIEKSYVRPTPMAYECKVSRADFRADVTSGKWQTYLRYACGVIFGVEAGLIDKREVPEACGLIVLTGDRWRMAKRPTLSTVENLPRAAWLKLLIDGVERQGANTIRSRQGAQWRVTKAENVKYGEIVGATIRDRLAVEDEIAYAKSNADQMVKSARQSAEHIRKQAEKEAETIAPWRAELRVLLGVSEDADFWQLDRAMRELRRCRSEHPDAAHHRKMTQQIRATLEAHGYTDCPPTNGAE